MNDKRVKAVALMLGGTVDWKSQMPLAKRAVEVADDADDCVRVPRKELEALVRMLDRTSPGVALFWKGYLNA